MCFMLAPDMYYLIIAVLVLLVLNYSHVYCIVY